MARRIETAAPSAPEAAQRSGRERCSCRCRVVTPMFGGVQTGVVDPVTPVRGTTVRGRLRFWWRATAGAECATADELFRKERDIWGGLTGPGETREEDGPDGHPSDVAVRVRLEGKGSDQSIEQLTGEHRSLPYALFPFIENKQQNCRTGVAFQLELEYHRKHRNDVHRALWAWCNLGGLGARTRRGCGALYCENFAPPDTTDPAQLASWVERHLGRPLAVEGGRPWPLVAAGLWVGDRSAATLNAWDQALGRLRHFRQGVGLGRNPGQGKRPGRSRWPEPDSIRRAARSHSGGHDPRDHMPQWGFPRAAFGMPIIFHFKDEKHGDPGDTTLAPPTDNGDAEGRNAGRMASPLVVRPLVCRGGEKALPMVVQLATPGLPEGIRLEGTGRARDVDEHDVIHPRFADYPDSPLQGHSKRGSALEGFVRFLEESGYREVGS
ncbi:MAG: type III-B CRISPR module RAMP protein Cmr1 [Synergistales bacterium]|nr:type III-B CRISPR module RAMP protein Cmr1 [Synergistales bacterium]